MTFIYYIFIDKQLKIKYPFLYSIVIITSLLILVVSLIYIIKFSYFILDDLINYVLKMNTSSSSKNPERSRQGGSDGNNGNPSGGSNGNNGNSSGGSTGQGRDDQEEQDQEFSDSEREEILAMH